MATVRDLIEGATVGEDSDGGLTATRTFLVSDIGGSPAYRAAKALSASGIPALFAYHPVLSDLQCYNRSAAPASDSSTKAFKVTCQYKKLDESEVPDDNDPASQGGSDTAQQNALITIGSTVQAQQTTNDKDGEEIILGPVDIPQDNGTVKKYPEQTGLVTIQLPQTTISFSERRAESPGGIAFAYVGKVNSAYFLGIPPGMCLCTRITGVSEDGGKTFKTDYEFQVNFSTWKAQVVYIDQDTGLPLQKASIDNLGKKRVEIYKSVDFNNLNLI